MTYEKLLANINDQEFAYDTLANALRAVVELHKPNGSFCNVCGEELFPEEYPCPTIQAIQKELN